jgi:hypothetical protein
MATSIVLLRLRSALLAGSLLFDGAHGALKAQWLEPMNNSEAFLNDIQKRTFAWFWEFSNDQNGLTLDRAPKEDAFASIAAVGFALTAFPVAVERGFLKRNDAVSKTLATLEFFKNSTQSESAENTSGYKGFYYHFLDPNTGQRFRQVELSTIDTALLMGGILFCLEYYDRDTELESRIRELADFLYRRVEWDWAQVRGGLISHGWKPESGMLSHDYNGYSEAMLLYVLALGSPTHPAREDSWHSFVKTCQWNTFYGQPHVNFTPLFGHQYSHIWMDFRGIQDDYIKGQGIDWFENSRRATYAQRAYAMDNPMQWADYGENVWGLTACDGPVNIEMEFNGEKRRFWTYTARGASAVSIRDDGTLAPTAAASSVAFAPEIVIPCLRNMIQRYGNPLYNKYGFVDAFNPSFQFKTVPLRHGQLVEGKGWFDREHLGIDQGPVLLMIENHRSGFVWEVMKRSAYIRKGLERAGFEGGWLNR